MTRNSQRFLIRTYEVPQWQFPFFLILFLVAYMINRRAPKVYCAHATGTRPLKQHMKLHTATDGFRTDAAGAHPK